MYIPPIYDHGHCGSLVHGGFLFRDFPPMLLIFHFHFTGVIIFYHDCDIYTVPSNFYFTFVLAIQIVIFWTVPSNLCFTFVLSILIVVFALFQVLCVLPLSCLSRLWFFFSTVPSNFYLNFALSIQIIVERFRFTDIFSFALFIKIVIVFALFSVIGISSLSSLSRSLFYFALFPVIGVLHVS